MDLKFMVIALLEAATELLKPGWQVLCNLASLMLRPFADVSDVTNPFSCIKRVLPCLLTESGIKDVAK